MRRSMQTTHSAFNIHDLNGMYHRKELVVNKTYQRNTGVWPATAKTFFIDTILEGFPFPKIYLYQNYDKSLRQPFKEIVDGQQCFNTINEFYNNKFKLSNVSKKYVGMMFDDLNDDLKERFLTYNIQVDIINAADETYILELFRRMNSYTAPLNDAEKRNAEFQGPFKWFVNELISKYQNYFESWKIFNSRELVRMKDAEFITDLALLLDKHDFINKTSADLKSIYKRYDSEFDKAENFSNIIYTTLNAIFEFNELRETAMIKDYAIYSLFAAFAHLKYGIFNNIDNIPKAIGKFYTNKECTKNLLLEIAAAHENKDIEGKYKEYVLSSLNTTTKKSQRRHRTETIIKGILNCR